MPNAIKNNAKFSVLGLDVDVSEEDKVKYKELENKKKSLESAPEGTLYIETFSEKTQISIFNLRERKGKIIKFLNNKNRKCYIKRCFDSIQGPVFTWSFEGTSKIYRMSVERFIEIYKDGDFHDIEPRRFEEVYFKPVSEVLKDIEDEIETLNKKYNTLYNNKKSEVSKEYWNNLNQYDKLEQEAKPERKVTKKDLSEEEALETAKKEKGVERVKSYWNSRLTKDEQARLMGWVAANIYSIRIYALLGGQSGNALSAEYGDVKGIKLREPEYNDNHERTSQDSIGGYVYFKSIKDSPIDLFEKIASVGRHFTLGGGTVPNRFADKNFALFLISEYSKYGFVPGKRNLYKEINVEGLTAEFKENEESFNDGYFPF